MSQRACDSWLVQLYDHYLVNQDPIAFAEAVRSRYLVSTLERLLENGGRMARRGAALALGLVADYGANHALGRALLDEDRGVRILAESSIRMVWRKSGTAQHRARLEVLICLNESRQFEEAIRVATRLIGDSPWLAEAWNQRAIARFHRSHFEEAIRDCHQALEINPYHFAAASGMGKCYLQMDHRIAALEAFRRALRLNPSLDDVRAQILYLQRSLKKDSQ